MFREFLLILPLINAIFKPVSKPPRTAVLGVELSLGGGVAVELILAVLLVSLFPPAVFF